MRIVRKIQLLAMALLFGAVAVPASAQLFHQLGFTVNGGYASMASSAKDIHPGYGFQTAVDFNYELQYGHLIFDTGLGVQWNDSRVKVDNTSFRTPLYYDSQNTPFRMGILTEQRQDVCRELELQLPMLVGGIYGHFYFLGGLKLNVPLYGRTRVKADVTTIGYYDKYVAPIVNDDRHGFRSDVPANMRGPQLKVLPVDLQASFELGYNFSAREDMVKDGVKSIREHRLRVAAYVDYSIIPLRGSYATVPFVLTSSEESVVAGSEQILPLNARDIYDIDRYTATHIMNTEHTLGSYLANFSVGVKFTMLIGSRQKFLCLSCESAVERGINNPNSGYRQSNNRQTESRTVTPTHHNDNGSPR